MTDLGPLEIIKRTGREPFSEHGSPLAQSLIDFWSWAFSDLVGNTVRGALGEFLVAAAIGKTESPRIGWDAFDLQTTEGIRIEVKSTAYVQSWKQKALSKPIFSIRETHAWSKDTNEYKPTKRRQADIYVFAVLAHQDKDN
jgi:hypothetical protein